MDPHCLPCARHDLNHYPCPNPWSDYILGQTLCLLSELGLLLSSHLLSCLLRAILVPVPGGHTRRHSIMSLAWYLPSTKYWSNDFTHNHSGRWRAGSSIRFSFKTKLDVVVQWRSLWGSDIWTKTQQVADLSRDWGLWVWMGKLHIFKKQRNQYKMVSLKWGERGHEELVMWEAGLAYFLLTEGCLFSSCVHK